MSGLEKLGQKMEESMQLGEHVPEREHQPKSEHPEVIDMTPSLPPHMQSIRSQTAEKVVKEMARTPLFMTSLEDTEGAGT